MLVGMIPALGSALTLKILKSAIPTDGRLSKHSPEELEKIRAEYQDSLGLSDKATFATDAFDNHAKGRVAEFRGLSTAKTPAGTVVSQKLHEIVNNAQDPNNANAKAVTTAFNTALTATDEFKTAQKDYAEKVKHFDDLKKLIPTEFSAKQLIGLMTELKSDARKAIVAQQTHEKQLFKDKFTKELPEQLKQSLSLKSDAEVDTVKANLITDLEETHKKQLSEFDKSTEESLKKLHEAAANEVNQLLFIANLYKNTGGEAMRQELRRLSFINQKKRRQEAGLGPEDPATISHSAGKISLSGITMDDLPLITSITGKEIKQNGGSFTLEHGLRFWSPLYYLLDPRKNSKNDAYLMAAAVKARGYDRIKVELNYENIDIARKYARENYEASIKAGFAPSKIKIEINGTECKPADLYKDKPRKLQQLNSQSDEIIAKQVKLSDQPEPSAPVDLTNIKAKLNNLRSAAKTAAEAAAKQANGAPQNTGP